MGIIIYYAQCNASYCTYVATSWTEKKFNLWCEIGWFLQRQSHNNIILLLTSKDPKATVVAQT